MSSVILRVAAGTLQPLFLLFSVFLLLRGHNEPGGGFTGGLMAACAFVLHGLAYDVGAARRLLRARPATLIGVGLLAALASGVLSLAAGGPFMQGRWVGLPGGVEVGSPLLFELGVYLVVLGSSLTMIFTLHEEDEE